LTRFKGIAGINEPLKRASEIILCVVLTLLCFGILTVYSASIVPAAEGAKTANLIKKQVIYVLVSMAALILAAHIDYHKLGQKSFWLLAVAMLMLILVLVFGTEVNGARRWFRFGKLSFQPAELARLCLVIYMAEFLTRKQGHIREFLQGFMPPVIVVGVAFILMMMQPDFGTAVLIAMTLGAMLFVAGIRLSHCLLIAVLAAPALIFLVAMAPYRLDRVLAFINPWEDPQGKGYHLIQSLIALGLGGTTGVGPGASLQKLSYLPEARGDFAFAILGSEFGFVGSMTVIALFCILIWQGMRICRHAPDLFGTLLSCGILCQIGLQALVNIAVVTGSMPTKGLPLPFVSFGGSSLILTMFSVGLLLNIDKHCRVTKEPDMLGARKMAVQQ